MGRFLHNAFPEPDPLKWEVIANLNLSSAGKKTEWLVLYITAEELGIRVSKSEYYRGLIWRDLSRFIPAFQ
jgi:hypothetical protein